MAEIESMARAESEQLAAAQPTEPIESRSFPRWHHLALGGIALLSIFLDFFQLGTHGFGNPYYSGAVRGMLDSWRNFFFVSADQSGSVSIDKPPLGFWLQVASAKLLGYTPFSLFLPQALAGVLSVVLLYYLVRRHFGIAAGLLAALALAVSPISVVTNRNNTIDSTLALVLLLGTWAVQRAVETGRLRWLLLSAALVGIGFNVKMLEAYLVVPAFGLLYLLAAPHGWGKRFGHLGIAGILLLGISLSWVTAVDLTPANQRPYVGSTQNDSELSLAIGYNGIDRLLGLVGPAPACCASVGADGPTGGTGSSGATRQPQFFVGPASAAPNRSPNAAQIETQPGATGGTGTVIIAPASGAPGPLRLFREDLGGQAGWLLPMAILGLIAVAGQRRLRFPSDRQQQSLLLWGTWLVTMGVFFSIAGFIHPYYLTEMAPATAALFGIGLVTMWQAYRRGSRWGWLLPLGLAATALEQTYLLSGYPTWSQWLVPLLALLVGLGVVVLVGTRVNPGVDVSRGPIRLGLIPVSLAVLALLIAPTVWAAIPVIGNEAPAVPQAGPTRAGDFGGLPGGMDPGSTNLSLVRHP